MKPKIPTRARSITATIGLVIFLVAVAAGFGRGQPSLLGPTKQRSYHCYSDSDWFSGGLLQAQGTRAFFLGGAGAGVYSWSGVTGRSRLFVRVSSIGADGSQLSGAVVGSYGVAFTRHYGGNLGAWTTAWLTSPRSRHSIQLSSRYNGDLNLEGGWSFALFVTPAFRAKPARLWRIDGTHAVRLAVDANSLTLLDVDGSRVLASRADGSLVVLGKDGSVTQVFPKIARGLDGVSPAGFLDGPRIVLGKPASSPAKPGRIEVYDATTGRLIKRWLTPGYIEVADAQGGLAAYFVKDRNFRDKELRVVRLSDGKRIVQPLQVFEGENPATARLTEAGLFYTTTARADPNDTSSQCQIAFVPRRVISAAF